MVLLGYFGLKWVKIGLTVFGGLHWITMGLGFGLKWVNTGYYDLSWFPLGETELLWVTIDCDGFLTGSNRLKWVTLGSKPCSWVKPSDNGFQWVIKVVIGSLVVWKMNSFGFVSGPCVTSLEFRFLSFSS